MPIMYVCEPCQDNCPENCGHDKRDDIRVMSDGTWVCVDCFENGDTSDIGWFSLPMPPEYVPASLLRPEDRRDGPLTEDI